MPVLFRGHIVGRANAGAGEIDFLIEHFWYTKISKFDFIIRDEDVRRFQIAVEYAFIVHVEDGEGDLCGPVDYFGLL
jgi:hypothetical protein